jgi:hypothetical protein
LDENHQDNRHILKVLSEDLRPDEKTVRHKDAGFIAGELDENWLPTVGKNGWILISADSRLWRRAVLRQVLFNAGVRAFIFTENTLRGETRAEIVRKALPEMRDLVRDNPPPFVASLTVEGHSRIQFDNEFHKAVLKREKASQKRRAKIKPKKKARMAKKK